LGAPWKIPGTGPETEATLPTVIVVAVTPGAEADAAVPDVAAVDPVEEEDFFELLHPAAIKAQTTNIGPIERLMLSPLCRRDTFGILSTLTIASYISTV
jgi:hypothetical protein